MKTEFICKYSFLNIVKKLCVEFDITILKVEPSPRHNIKFFLSGNHSQMKAFLVSIVDEYNSFNKALCAEQKIFSVTS